MTESLTDFGLVIAPEKVQMGYPFQYLGFQIAKSGIHPQKIANMSRPIKKFA